MDRIVITWGLIPNENLSETIYCGDAENSETMELSFEIIGDDCKGIDNDFNFDVSGNQLWKSNSKIYVAISKYLSKHFGSKISPEYVYGGYVFVNDEPDEHSSSFTIIKSEAGVFSNHNQIHNGKIYLRYYFEEQGEMYDEKVCLLLL